MHLNFTLPIIIMAKLLNIALFVFIFDFVDETRSENDVELIYLPKKNPMNKAVIPIEFTAFGEDIQLKLQRNDLLLSPFFKVWIHDGSDLSEEIPELGKSENSYYLHLDDKSAASASFSDQGLHGLILLDNVTLEISPINDEIYDNFYAENEKDEMPHLVKKTQIPKELSKFLKSNVFPIVDKESDQTDSKSSENSRKELTVELAVFFDEPGYKLFSPFFDGDEKQIRDMLLAYVNAIQALYYHPSLGIKINIALVRLDIMRQQPATLPHYDGERGKLLDSFCNYTTINNPRDDDDPNHWDLGIYVSGLDFYANENGKKDGATMGLATVSGVCFHQYSCVIAELGVTNRFGKPYPSAGFTSIYIAAHEIGHNLGMHHDSIKNSCPRDGYIMSPSRGTQGETIWSSCSREVAIDLPRTKSCLLDKPDNKITTALNHSRFLTLPGREWTAKRQCELLLRDKDAIVVSLVNACQALQCRSPHRSGYYYAGPALDGTICKDGNECRGGECLPVLQLPEIPLNPDKLNNENNWSKWREGPCKSGCIQKSMGSKSKHRICNYNRKNTNGNDCNGVSYETMLCRDDKFCRKRITSEEFATLQCQIFRDHLPELDEMSSGLQAPHELERPWMACAIFCRRKDIASYYTPRVELNDLGIDPYFPDGTWCHKENNEDYFCHRHHCLPVSFRFSKDLWNKTDDEESDMIFGLQNAMPNGNKISEELMRYFSLGLDKKPLSKFLSQNKPMKRDEWTDKDYIELPQDFELFN